MYTFLIILALLFVLPAFYWWLVKEDKTPIGKRQIAAFNMIGFGIFMLADTCYDHSIWMIALEGFVFLSSAYSFRSTQE